MQQLLAAITLAATMSTNVPPLGDLTHADEQTGIAYLAQQAVVAENEDAFVYTPSPELWHRFDGYKSKRVLILRWSLVSDVCATENMARIFHYHLLSNSLIELLPSTVDLLTSLEDDWTFDRENRGYPSALDMNASVSNEYLCYHANPTAKLEHAVVSVSGTPMVVDGTPTEQDLQSRVVRWRVDEDSKLRQLIENVTDATLYPFLIAPLAEREAIIADSIISDEIRAGKSRVEILKNASEKTPFTFWEEP